MAKYYGLMVKEDDQWSFAFGDKSKAIVIAEYRDYRDHDIRAMHMDIITFESMPSASDIDALVKDWNS